MKQWEDCTSLWFKRWCGLGPDTWAMGGQELGTHGRSCDPETPPHHLLHSLDNWRWGCAGRVIVNSFSNGHLVYLTLCSNWVLVFISPEILSYRSRPSTLMGILCILEGKKKRAEDVGCVEKDLFQRQDECTRMNVHRNELMHRKWAD